MSVQQQRSPASIENQKKESEKHQQKSWASPTTRIVRADEHSRTASLPFPVPNGLGFVEAGVLEDGAEGLLKALFDKSRSVVDGAIDEISELLPALPATLELVAVVD